MKLATLFATSIVVLAFMADKCRQMVGEEALSRSWRDRFTFVNCFDMSYGTMACMTKELVKLYLNYIRALYVHEERVKAMAEAKRQEESKLNWESQDVKRRVEEKGEAAAKRASRQANHVIGPVISSGWDFFEALYVGSTWSEAMYRATGTFIGAYVGGITGEGRLRWIGFLLGSQLGSWVGGRVGLMLYDVAEGMQHLVQFYNGGKKQLSVIKS